MDGRVLRKAKSSGLEKEINSEVYGDPFVSSPVKEDGGCGEATKERIRELAHKRN